MSIPFDVGCYVSAGGRTYNEDRVTVIKDFNIFIPEHNDKRRSFFAVFDGHGGSLIAEFLSQNFHVILAKNTNILRNPMKALQETWQQMDEKCFGHCQKVCLEKDLVSLPRDGSTATVVLIIGDDIYIANCGDSAANYFSTDGSICPLTEDHGTGNEIEVNRCVQAGGELKPQMGYVPSGLLVTRSFGDFHAKKPQFGGKIGVVVSSHGKIVYAQLARAKIKHLLIASDGIWDALPSARIQGTLDKYSSDAEEALKQQVVSSPRSVTPQHQIASKQPLGTIVGDVTELSSPQSLLAQKLCEEAVASSYWREAGAAMLLFPPIPANVRRSTSTFLRKSQKILGELWSESAAMLRFEHLTEETELHPIDSKETKVDKEFVMAHADIAT